jgi:hypothetical protein
LSVSHVSALAETGIGNNWKKRMFHSKTGGLAIKRQSGKLVNRKIRYYFLFLPCSGGTLTKNHSDSMLLYPAVPAIVTLDLIEVFFREKPDLSPSVAS